MRGYRHSHDRLRRDIDEPRTPPSLRGPHVPGSACGPPPNTRSGAPAGACRTRHRRAGRAGRRGAASPPFRPARSPADKSCRTARCRARREGTESATPASVASATSSRWTAATFPPHTARRARTSALTPARAGVRADNLPSRRATATQFTPSAPTPPGPQRPDAHAPSSTHPGRPGPRAVPSHPRAPHPATAACPRWQELDRTPLTPSRTPAPSGCPHPGPSIPTRRPDQHERGKQRDTDCHPPSPGSRKPCTASIHTCTPSLDRPSGPRSRPVG